MADRVAGMLRSPWPRLVLLLALLGVAGWLALAGGGDATVAVRGFVSRHGAWGPVVFVLVYAVGTVIFFPVSVLSAAAGVLFGPPVGVLLVLAGALAGASGAFLLGRVLSRPAVERLAGGRIDRLNALLARRGTLAVLFVRLVPLFPFSLVNYGSAVTAIGFGQYFTGTALGILPATVAYVTVGGNLTNPGSPAFLIATGGLLVLAGGGAVLARRLRPPGGR